MSAENRKVGCLAALEQITRSLMSVHGQETKLCHLNPRPMPDRVTIEHMVDRLREVLFPVVMPNGEGLRSLESRLHAHLEFLASTLNEQIFCAFAHGALPEPECAERSETVTSLFLKSLPQIASWLSEDLEAAYQGDPAATGYDEIINCYPGMFAVTVYRLAHVLWTSGVPLIPRMMGEIAHTRTGIDIHPGATIGRRFFIDHGTGVVVGETCHIGDNVRLYQGVTLGALNFPRDARGELIRGQKRHPTLEDNVVVYANATILGGDTVIGHHSIIGSSVWVNQCITPYTVVTVEKPILRFLGPGVKMVLDYQI